MVGAGPAGAGAAYWLARDGHRVTIVEKWTFPRDKTCGDALTPRAVLQLQDMGMQALVSELHHTDGVIVHGPTLTRRVPWPAHPSFPTFGAVARRCDLDGIVADRARRAGATLLCGHEAVQPIIERGFVRGAVVQPTKGDPFELRSTYVVVADGANSRFGRALGTFRTREWPYATAIRNYWPCPGADDRWIRSDVALTDRNGQSIPGYGWVIPIGDGRVNVGVGLLSTFREFKGVNTTHLLDQFVLRMADRIGIEPDHALDRPQSGRIPMGHSVGPSAGPSYLVVGDAAGAVSPFNGDGIAYAYETGRLAAHVLHEALTADDPAALQRYPALIDERYGEYFQVARLFASSIGRPAVMRRLSRTGLRSQAVVEAMVRVQNNLLRPDTVGAAELGYRAFALAARLAPNA